MDFREMVYQQQFAEAEKDMKRKWREIEQVRKHIVELDHISNEFMRTTSTAQSAMNSF